MVTSPPATTDASGVSRRRAETRDRLIDAAITVFARVGVDQARVEDISEEAGFTRGAFYSNFTDKDDLIVALLQRQFSVAAEVVETSLVQVLSRPRPDDFTELVHAALDAFAEHVPDDDWLLAELSLRLYALREPRIAAHLRTYEVRHRTSLATVLEHAFSEAGLRCTLPMEHLVAITLAIHAEAMVRERSAPDAAGAAPTSRDLVVSLLASCLEPVDGP